MKKAISVCFAKNWMGHVVNKTKLQVVKMKKMKGRRSIKSYKTIYFQAIDTVTS